MRQPIQVLVYPVKAVDNGWEYLLLHRLASRGDFWQGVTGGVEQGEEFADAARREMIEETGLVPSTIQIPLSQRKASGRLSMFTNQLCLVISSKNTINTTVAYEAAKHLGAR